MRMPVTASKVPLPSLITLSASIVQCNAMQCNAMQCNAMPYNTIQYNTSIPLSRPNESPFTMIWSQIRQWCTQHQAPVIEVLQSRIRLSTFEIISFPWYSPLHPHSSSARNPHAAHMDYGWAEVQQVRCGFHDDPQTRDETQEHVLSRTKVGNNNAWIGVCV